MRLSSAFQTITFAATLPAVLVSHFLLTTLGFWNPEGRVTDTTVKLQTIKKNLFVKLYITFFYVIRHFLPPTISLLLVLGLREQLLRID